jgi:antitoxin CptB
MGYSAAPSALAACFSHRMPMDDRRKKLRFRAWRRGFLELDLILGAFADTRLSGMDEPGLDAFESLLNANDQDVYAWVTEAAEAPAEFNTSTLEEVRAFRYEMAARS